MFSTFFPPKLASDFSHIPQVTVPAKATDVLDLPWLPRASPPVAHYETVNIQIRKGVRLAFAAIQSYLSKSLCAHQSHPPLTRTVNPV